MKDEFIKIYQENIKREGATELLEYISKSDFFEAPASSRFHMSVKGGLCAHSVNVFKRLVANAETEFGADWEKHLSKESLAICGLLHDLCKIRFYKEDFRNQKDENGNWVKVPYYKKEEVFPFGHGEKSVFIINNYMKLTGEEAIAINWHMGGFDMRVLGGSQSISEAYDKYPLGVMLHVADLQATYLDENPRFQTIKENK